MSLRKGIKLEVKTLLRSKNVYILCGTLALLYCIIMLIKMKTYDFMNGLFASHGNHVFLCTIKDVISSSIGVVMAWYIGGNITKDFKYQMTYYFKSLGNYSKKY